MFFKFLLLIFVFAIKLNCADVKGAKEQHKFLIHQSEQEKQEHEKEIHAQLYSLGFPHELASLIIEYTQKTPDELISEFSQAIYKIIQNQINELENDLKNIRAKLEAKEEQSDDNDYEEEDYEETKRIIRDLKEIKTKKKVEKILNEIFALSMPDKLMLIKIILKNLEAIDIRELKRSITDVKKQRELEQLDDKLTKEIGQLRDKLNYHSKRIFSEIVLLYVMIGQSLKIAPNILFLIYEFIYSVLDERTKKEENIKSPELVINELKNVK